jgi:hypothetical protein
VASTYTADARVFPDAFSPYEAGREGSHRLVARTLEQAVPIIVQAGYDPGGGE